MGDLVVQGRRHVLVCGGEIEAARAFGQLRMDAKIDDGDAVHEGAVVGGNGHVAGGVGVGGAVPQQDGICQVVTLQAGTLPVGDVHGGVVSQVQTHAGKIVPNRDAEGMQVGGWADAGVEEQEGGADGAGAEDGLAGGDVEGLAAAFRLDADAALAVEEKSPHVYAAPDGEVHPVPVGVQVGDGGVDSDAADLVEGQHADAVGLGVVHVGEVSVSG